MIEKGDKMIPIGKEQATKIKKIITNSDFDAVKALFRIEEHNIKEAMASLSPEDDKLTEKTIHYLGRLRQLRYLNGYFDKIRKKKDPDELAG